MCGYGTFPDLGSLIVTAKKKPRSDAAAGPGAAALPAQIARCAREKARIARTARVVPDTCRPSMRINRPRIVTGFQVVFLVWSWFLRIRRIFQISAISPPGPEELHGFI
jgi:hypothetical protein